MYQEVDDSFRGSTLLGPGDQPLIQHELFSLKRDLKPVLAKSLYTTTILRDLGSSTGTTLRLNNGVLHATADSHDQLDTLTRKLENCEQAFVSGWFPTKSYNSTDVVPDRRNSRS